MSDIGALVYHDTDWPHGLRCMNCDHLFADGEQYEARPVAMIVDAGIEHIVCLECVNPDDSR